MVYFLAKSDKSLIVELWEYIESTYFSPEMPYLENISFGTGTLVTLRTILIGLTVGVIAASLLTLFNKRYIGGFIRKMISEGCVTPEGAKTLGELGFLRHVAVRSAIKSGGNLSTWVRCVEEDEFIAELDRKREEFEEAHKDEKKPPKFKAVEFKRNCSTMHFYIPEDKKELAERKFNPKGANLLSVMLVCIIALLLCAGLSFALPELIKMMDNFVSVVNGN